MPELATRYWAVENWEILGPKLVEKIEAQADFLRRSPLLAVWQLSHEMYQWGLVNGQLEAVGKNREFVKLVLNHYGNLVRHIHVSTTGARPGFVARAVNGDYKSRSQARDAKGLLEYELTQKQGEQHHTRAMLNLILTGEANLFTWFNPMKGPLVEATGMTGSPAPMVAGAEAPGGVPAPGTLGGSAPAAGSPAAVEDVQALAGMATRQAPVPGLEPATADPEGIYGGDIDVEVVHSVDLIRDVTLKSAKQVQWWIVRTRVNRWDLIAHYAPESDTSEEAVKLRQALMSAEAEDVRGWEHRTVGLVDASARNRDTDLVCLYHFIHEPTRALPTGRWVTFIDQHTQLANDTLADRKVEKLSDVVQRADASEIEGIPFGYTPMWDLMQPQAAVNIGESTLLTNLANFGVQTVVGPSDAVVTPKMIAEGMRMLRVSGARDGGKVEGLNLLQVSEAHTLLPDRWTRGMETISGVNSVARGNPEASLKSGRALALVQAQFIEFTKGYQSGFVFLWESFCTAIVRHFKRNVPLPRLAAIAGKGERSYVKELKGADVEQIDRVLVEIAPATTRTAAGRLDTANDLLDRYGPEVIPPVEYMQVRETGQLDLSIHDELDEMMLIEEENEKLLDGEVPPVLRTDTHAMHRQKHRKLLYSPDVRRDPVLRDAVLAHDLWHEREELALASLGGMQGAIMAGKGMPPGQEGAPPELPAPGEPGSPEQAALASEDAGEVVAGADALAAQGGMMQ